jgi:predicted Fe-Mo cluster-binding NifX family protein
MDKAAFATWNERIAPVFDVARLIHLVEIKDGRIVRQRQIDVTGDMANLKAAWLAALGVDTLVCGAISRPLEAMVAAYGIQVIPFVAGNLQEIIQAWVCGKLADSNDYAMPGCRKAGGRRWQGAVEVNRGNSRRENTMNGNTRRQKGPGQGTGPGRKGQRRGGGGRAADATPGAAASRGACVCPHCGHLTPHERGVPCTQNKCPQCWAVMTRQ